MTLIEQVRSALEKKAIERTEKLAALEVRQEQIETLTTTEKRDASSEELDSLKAVSEELRSIEEEIKGLEVRESELADLEERKTAALNAAKEVRKPLAHVTNEAKTYRSDNMNEVSFLQDAYLASFSPSAFEARQRIERHQNEYRDVATTALGGFVVPQYDLANAAEYMAAGAPLANNLFRNPEPTTMSTVIPTVTTAASAAAQATQNSGVSETDIAITNVTVPTVTIAGQQDISRQSLELGTGVEGLIMRELISQWHTALDSAIINTDGTSGTIEGLLASDGIGTSTYTDASPTVAEFLVQLGDSFADITTATHAAPDLIVVAPRRWEWLLASVGSDGRPLVQVNQYNSQNNVGLGNPGYGAVGTIRGVPVVVDANVPVNLGAGTNEDRVIVLRTPEIYFAAGNEPRALKFEATTAGSLSVKAVVYGYAAFSAERRPGAVSVMSGTGLIL
jgi:HK97 family phage major capsid protein